MRGGLPKKEPEILERWQKLGLYDQLRKARKNAPKFVLHDGPPYANGQLHIGHALNKILKDVINRSQSMLGKNANYVPGWDCHGLPIEWKIEEQYRKKGKDKDEVPIAEFRQECRDFAAHWLNIQSEEFQRLGILGDWGNPYTTMRYEAESIIAAEMGKFLMNGSLYRGSKPVMWSPVEKTALAEAEVEYSDHKSVTIFARFKVVSCPLQELQGASFVIWTTTPWTMPGNRAMACGAEIAYSALRITETSDSSLAQLGEVICLADELKDRVFDETGIVKADVVTRFTGADIAGSVAHHPMFSQGYDHDVPLFLADYVTTEQGTGFVHIAPGHGPEDYALAHLQHGVEVPDTVGEDGLIAEHLPLFGGMHVLRDNQKIADIMNEYGGLLGIGTTSPATALHVYNTGAGLKVEAAGTSPFTQTIAEFRYLGNGNSITIQNIFGAASINSSGTMQIASAGGLRLSMDATNSTFTTNVIPSADNSNNLGAADKRWANIFSADLQLSNEGTEGNEVDGTTGSWTIQEGEDDLYLLNRKNGKKYKFKLEEVE